ncbi:MAG TPA: hypothetical protein VFW53_05820 [Gallionella sp.]|nr:hypothetical protein [Gallionella sp.]
MLIGIRMRFARRRRFVFTHKGNHGKRNALESRDALIIQHHLPDLEIQRMQGAYQRGARIGRRKLLPEKLRIEWQAEYARQTTDQPQHILSGVMHLLLLT